MPKLKFLDAKSITKFELSVINSEAPKVVAEMKTQIDRTSFWQKLFRPQTPKEEESRDEVDSLSYKPLPADDSLTQQQQSRSSYTKLRHFYKGTESQGNRFIGNKML